jgi:enediyne biosynthesis protein E3
MNGPASLSHVRVRNPGGRDQPSDESRFLRLPHRLTDFRRRGFRLDRRESRVQLEHHADSFVTGFNIAARHWRDPHAALAKIANYERGFAYEGAGMHAALRDLATFGCANALSRLLNGAGDDYVHLIHVGVGWALVPTRLPLPVRLPSTPLLRWLALDGAGFAETYFGGLTAMRRRTLRKPTEQWQARVAGCGRALWFVESADPSGVNTAIERCGATARPHLWSGVGLAATYAGGIEPHDLDRLAASADRYLPYFAQGALFAAAARRRARIVPPHTESVCRQLFGIDAEVASAWTDEAAKGLESCSDISAYTEWKSRLRSRFVHLQ